MNRDFVTALLGQPFGLEGLIRVTSLSGETSHIKKIKKITLRQPAKTGDSVFEFDVERFAEKGGGLFVKLIGIDTPEDARQWRGAEVIVKREDAAPLSAKEFYIEDLKTLTIVSPDGAELGIVRDVIEGGGGFLLEAELLDGQSANRETRLIPFRDEFIGGVYIKERRIELRVTWILE